MEEQKVIPVSIAIPPDLAHRARVAAALQGKSRSQLIREVLEEALSNAPAAGPLDSYAQKTQTGGMACLS